MRASGPPTSTRSCSAISTQASRRRISPLRWCWRPRPTCASSARPASRTPAPPARPQSIRASRRSRRRARASCSLSGVEQMTTTPPGPRDPRSPALCRYASRILGKERALCAIGDKAEGINKDDCHNHIADVLRDGDILRDIDRTELRLQIEGLEHRDIDTTQYSEHKDQMLETASAKTGNCDDDGVKRH